MAETSPGASTGIDHLLAEAGIGQPAIAAAHRIDALLQAWRRRIGRQGIGQSALRDLEVPLDLAQFDVLAALAAPGSSADDDEIMVQTIAERLRIDPSRSSRVLAELVTAGYVVRAVSQADARRTIVRLTPRGAALVEAVQAYKYLMFADFLSEWSSADTERFLRLFERFTTWSEDISARQARYAAQIGELRAGLSGPTGT